VREEERRERDEKIKNKIDGEERERKWTADYELRTIYGLRGLESRNET